MLLTDMDKALRRAKMKDLAAVIARPLFFCALKDKTIKAARGMLYEICCL